MMKYSGSDMEKSVKESDRKRVTVMIRISLISMFDTFFSWLP